MCQLKMDDLSGYLELYIGPMWSGKTSKLVKIYKELKKMLQKWRLLTQLSSSNQNR